MSLIGSTRSSTSTQQAWTPSTSKTGSSDGRSVTVGSGDSASAGRVSPGKIQNVKIGVFSRTIQAGPQAKGATASTALGSVHTPGIGARLADKEAQLTRQMSGLNHMIENLPKDSQGYSSSKAAVLMLGHVHELLSATPAGAEEAEQHIEDLDEAFENLTDALNTMQSAGRSNDSVKDLHVVLKALTNDLGAAVDHQKKQLDAGMMSNPLSEKACFQCKANWAEGAIAMLDSKTTALKADGNAEAGRVLDNAKSAVQSHLDGLKRHNGLDALDKKQIQHIMGFERSGAKAALKEKLGPIDKKLKLDVDGESRAAAKAMAGTADFTAGSALSIPDSDPLMSEEMMLEAVVERAFEQAGVPTDRIKHELNEARKAHLNSQTWATIKGEVPLRHGSSTYVLQSEIKPQSQITGQFTDLNGGGVNCHMTMASKHGTNVAVSSAKIGNDTVFSGIRHGILSPYDLSAKKIGVLTQGELAGMVKELLLETPDGKAASYLPLGKDADAIAARMKSDKGFATLVADCMRTEGSYRRALDVATTALVSDSAKLQRALNGETVALKMNSISLVTPGGLEGGKEKKMLQDQVSAWGRLRAGSPVTVTVKDAQGNDRPVKIDVQTRAFNFGVNKPAIGLTGRDGINRLTEGVNYLNGWSASDKVNTSAMDQLIGTLGDRNSDGLGGDVAEWLRTSGADAQTKAHVRTLAGQIRDIWDAEAHRTQGVEPYKIVSRLAVLTHMMGETPCWNCKSGKDRTGNLDTEAKFLAAQIHTTGNVPVPDRERSDEEKGNFFRLGRFGGNHEAQLMNTGVPGYKYDGLSSLTEQMGGKKALEVLKGLSKYIGS